MSGYSVSSAEIRFGIANSFETLFSEELGLNHARRLQAYRRYWLAYFGEHWSYKRDPGEVENTVNYCRKAINSHLDFAFSKGFENIVPDDPSTTENEQLTRDFIKVKLDETWEKNNKELWLVDCGQGGGVTGDVFARVSWDKTDLFEDAYARVDIIPSHFCFPEFCGPHGVDRKRIKRLLIVIPTFMDVNWNELAPGRLLEKNLGNNRVTLVMKAELWTSPVVDENGNIQTPAMVYEYEDNNLISERVNPLQEIPVVHIPNYPVTGEYYGISDLVDVVDLNTEFNEKITDISDIIDYHGSPQTIVKGCRLNQLERGANRIWGIPETGDVFNLELKGDMSAALKHVEFLKKSFQELSSCPDHFWGTPLPISNTSGAALQIMFMPVLQKRDMKAMVYGAGIQRINRLILRMNEIADLDFAKKMKNIKNRYRNKVKFPDPMPRDEVRELERNKLEKDLGITSRKFILKSRGLTDAQAKDIMKDADKDREEEALQDYEVGLGSGNGNFARGGSSDTRGEKISEAMNDKADGPNSPKEEE
jgi:hypothetical protein